MIELLLQIFKLTFELHPRSHLLLILFLVFAVRTLALMQFVKYFRQLLNALVNTGGLRYHVPGQQLLLQP